jgi:hypothetical protein
VSDFAEAARAVLSTACAAVDLDDTGATRLHVGTAALFHLPAAALVVRVDRPAVTTAVAAGAGTLADAALDTAPAASPALSDAQTAVDIAGWLARLQFPAARTADLPQPSVVDGHPVTFWRYLPGTPATGADSARLGAALWILHGIEQPEDGPVLPEFDLPGRIRTRVRAASVPDEQRSFLLRRLDELETEVAGLTFPLETALVHGFPKLGHLIVDAERTTLIDFTAAGWGQPEWDLALLATEQDTAGRLTPAEYTAFTDAYGWDVRGWSGYPTLQALHQLNLATQPG